MSAPPRATVVGGGIIGSFLALSLAERGCETHLTTNTAPQGLVDEILARARRRLAGRVSVTSTVVGVRVLPRDGLSIVGWAPGLDAVYMAATHSVVTLAPLLGQLAAHEIRTGNLDPRLTAYRPDRFRGAGAAPQ